MFLNVGAMTPGTVRNEAGFKPVNPEVVMKATLTKLGMEIVKGGVLSKTNNEEGEELTLRAAARGVLDLGHIQPKPERHIFVQINPGFYEVAQVSYQQIFEPREESPLILHINTFKKLDLEKMDWIARLYVLA